jgi:hypothetical protein
MKNKKLSFDNKEVLSIDIKLLLFSKFIFLDFPKITFNIFIILFESIFEKFPKKSGNKKIITKICENKVVCQTIDLSLKVSVKYAIIGIYINTNALAEN